MKDLLEGYKNKESEKFRIERDIKKLEILEKEEISISGSNLSVNGDIRAKRVCIF